MTGLGIFQIPPIRTALSGAIPVKIREYRPSANLCLCSFLLVCAPLLGGGTHGGFLSDTILELAAIPVLLIAVSSLVDQPIWQTKNKSGVRTALMFCLVIASLPLVQLIPLPPSIWTHFPGREEMVQVFALVGDPTPWMPISVSPSATWQSVLSLLPPMAIFLLTLQLGYHERRAVSLVILTVGVVSVFVGLTQVAQGPTSSLRFFTVTNDTEAVGFFANRNHFAALLYSVLLFAAVWALELGFNIKSWTDLKNFEAGKATALLGIFIVIIIVIAGEAMARSRAGLALTIVALLGIFALSFKDRRHGSGAKASKIILVAIMFGIVLSMQFAVYRILGRFATDPLENARTVFAHNTITAAKAFTPFGSGIGTFVPVYQLFEQAGDLIPNTYANRAHNDFLELWLETGVFGPILLGVFVFWFATRALTVWRRTTAGESPFDCNLIRAATVVIALLLAHSAVDYPMRTEAIMGIFAVCCALLIVPLHDGEEGVRFAASLERYLVRRKTTAEPETVGVLGMAGATTSAVPARGTYGVVAQPRPTARRWGAEIDWPDAWRNSRAPEKQSDPKSDTNSPTKADTER